MAGPCVWDLAADLPEVDVIMGFEQYQNLPASIGGMLGVETRKDTGGEAAARSRVRVGSASPPFRPEAGLTLVHFLAQPKPFCSHLPCSPV